MQTLIICRGVLSSTLLCFAGESLVLVYVTTFMCIILSEKRLVHSELSVTLPKDSAASLLVISPDHGKVEYKWEKRVSSFLEISHPGHACYTSPLQHSTGVLLNHQW